MARLSVSFAWAQAHIRVEKVTADEKPSEALIDLGKMSDEHLAEAVGEVASLLSHISSQLVLRELRRREKAVA
jgi:hypothetical protein